VKTLHASLPRLRKIPQDSEAIHTTLYDLIAALNAETESHEEDIILAALMHILNTKRVLCTGALQGYRITCGTPVDVTQPKAQE